MSKVALVINPETGDIYEYQGKVDDGFQFENHTSGKVGVVSKEMARKNLKLSVHLNVLANQNDAIMELIKTLNLGILTSTSNA